MKTKSILIAILLSIVFKGMAQEKEYGRYTFHYKWASTDTVYMKVVPKKTKLKSGWELEEEVGSMTIRRVLKYDTVIVVKKDSIIKLHKNLKVLDVKHTDDKPNILTFNPKYSEDSLDPPNHVGYIKIPENSFATMSKFLVKWNPVTIPFSIRPRLNEKIGSKITSDLKIGSSISLDYNLEFFKNRRIKAKKSVYGLSAGIAFGLTKVTLDKNTTSLYTRDYEIEEDGLAFFIGPGVGANIRGFQIVWMWGWDLGLTSNVKNDWNYNKEKYYGVGVGIDLNIFGKL